MLVCDTNASLQAIDYEFMTVQMYNYRQTAFKNKLAIQPYGERCLSMVSSLYLNHTIEELTKWANPYVYYQHSTDISS